MATKYAEGFLAIKYRTKDANGQAAGGPMHYITLGMGQKWKPLAVFFAISGVLVALLGIGTFRKLIPSLLLWKRVLDWNRHLSV